MKLPKLPNNFYRYDALASGDHSLAPVPRFGVRGSLYKVWFGDFYIIHQEEYPGAKFQRPVGTILVEINASKDLLPGEHWDPENRTHLAAIPIDILDNKELRSKYYCIGFNKEFLTKIKNDEHFFELILKY